MTSEEPMHPQSIETVLFEPDLQQTLAVLPGALWLSPGDIVELENPPRDARVLSSRLQLREGRARVLIVLDVSGGPDDVLRGDTPTEAVLAVDVDEAGPVLGDELDRELQELASDVEPVPEEGPSTP